MFTAKCLIGTVIWLCLLSVVAPAEPQPGDVYREFTWTRIRQGKTIPQLVFSPTGTRPAENLRSPRTGNIELDLSDALRAEVVVEHWSGHVGTSKKSIRFNDRAWIELPLPANTPGVPEGFIAVLSNAVVAVPLGDLQDGLNEFALTCGPQICHNFDYPAFACYGLTVRIYLDPSEPHSTGAIVSPKSGEKIGDNPEIKVRIDNPQSETRRIDIIAEYEDYDWDGDGRFHEWQYGYEFTHMRHHVGTTDCSPYRVKWNTRWIPDQDRPIRLLAHITDTLGTTYVTQIVNGVTFVRDRSVRLYKASEVPDWFSVRDGKVKHCTLDLPDNLTGATAARLVVATHGPHEEAGAFGVNDSELGVVPGEKPGQAHPKRFHIVEMPLDLVKQGLNRFYATAPGKGHGMEMLWPGPAILIEYAESRMTENIE